MPAISGPGGSRTLLHVLARHGPDLSDKPEHQHAPTESNRVHGTWKPAGRHGLTRKSSVGRRGYDPRSSRFQRDAMTTLALCPTSSVPCGNRIRVSTLRGSRPWPARRRGHHTISCTQRGTIPHLPIESRRSRPLDDGCVEPVIGIEPKPGALRKRCSALELHRHARAPGAGIEPATSFDIRLTAGDLSIQTILEYVVI